ncbi:MAG: hypothetical protein ACJA1R_001984 [Flavobacteriales bacterium]|jgi:hypothetical protein
MGLRSVAEVVVVRCLIKAIDRVRRPGSARGVREFASPTKASGTEAATDGDNHPEHPVFIWVPGSLFNV